VRLGFEASADELEYETWVPITIYGGTRTLWFSFGAFDGLSLMTLGFGDPANLESIS
jgi:hypothetical protein